MNNDLISRSALMARYCEDCSLDIREDCKTDPICGGMMWILEEPAVDAVEAVRCKDCVFKQAPKQYGDLQCKILGVPMKNDDFCSYGERREDG